MLQKIADLPIGVFDSGIGGLTVLKALRQALPNEHLLYLGDTARLPYGTKSPETITQYALQSTEFLVQQGIKLLLVACNTASAAALPALQAKYHALPVIGVIEAGVKAALDYTHNKKIAVLGTESTIHRHAYRNAFWAIHSDIDLHEIPCSLLVSLVEEGWIDGDLVEQIIFKIVEPVLSLPGKAPDTFLLGCTHFPVLANAIQNVIGDEAVLINPADCVAAQVEQTLSAQGLKRDAVGSWVRFCATDNVERFQRVAHLFLQDVLPLSQIHLVDL